MSNFWKRLFHADYPPSEVDERAPYLDVGVVNEASRRIGRGDVLDGVAFGLSMAVQDAASAHSIELSPGLTYPEILRGSFPRRMPPSMIEHFERMYALYEPIRFGPAAPVREATAKEFIAELRALYASESLQRMYSEFRYDSQGINVELPHGPSTRR